MMNHETCVNEQHLCLGENKLQDVLLKKDTGYSVKQKHIYKYACFVLSSATQKIFNT